MSGDQYLLSAACTCTSTSALLETGPGVSLAVGTLSRLSNWLPVCHLYTQWSSCEV